MSEQLETKMIKNKLIIISITSFLLIITAIVAILTSDNHTEEVANTFIASLAANDAEASYELLGRDLANEVGRHDGWSERLSRVEIEENGFELINQTSIENPNGDFNQYESIESFEYEVQMENGSMYKMTVFVAINQNSDARVIEFDSRQL